MLTFENEQHGGDFGIAILGLSSLLERAIEIDNVNGSPFVNSTHSNFSSQSNWN